MNLKKISARFYLSSTGANPVRDWLLDLEKADRATIGHDIGTLEYGWPVGMPLCRSLGNGLWEVRCTLPSSRIARVLFCIADESLMLLHGFIKKTQKTPDTDLKLARKRMKEVQS
jgi:phage-related protein